MAMNEAHKRMVKHIRSRIKASGIKANVSGRKYYGGQSITVSVKQYPKDGADCWTPEELESLHTIATVNKLTMVRNTPVFELETMKQLTGKLQFDFYFHG